MIQSILPARSAALSDESELPDFPFGRESILRERLLPGLMLQALYSLCSERHVTEPIEFDVPVRWFAGLGDDNQIGDTPTLGKNYDRLSVSDVAVKFLVGVLAQPKVKTLLSSGHFSGDQTPMVPWTSAKSFRPKDGTK